MKRAKNWVLSILRWNFTGKVVAVVAVIAIVAGLAFLLSGRQPASAQNLGSPNFANPSEVTYRATEKRLRAVMQITAGEYSIPNVGKAVLRQFNGWDPAKPAPTPRTEIGPGPTLRARLGDQVQISFLNKVDDNKFAYTFDTNSPPGYSSYGCDQSGTLYPGTDKFPNCFHGSSTANIHFHGTHTNPDGLGDNVLVQVLPQLQQPDWSPEFNAIFNSGKIPQRWKEMPIRYQNLQMALVKRLDAVNAQRAIKNGLKPPASLYEQDMQMIANGQWPEYLVGAFPNFFDIPDYSSGKWKAGQAPGTHWYHAHKHGSTSLHILNGLAGVLVIESSQEGGYDHFIRKFYNWGASYGDHEKIIVFQQFDTTQNLERPPNAPSGKGIKQVLVNGKLTPTITMKPGEVQLWRALNATEGNNAGKLSNDLFATGGFTFKQTAMDGVQFSPTNYQNQPYLSSSAPGGQVPNGLALAGGNRTDLLVQAPTKTGVTPFCTGGPCSSGGTVLFFVNVTGDAVTYPNGAFPSTWCQMPAFLNDLAAPGPNDIKNPGSPVKFQWEAGRTGTGRDNAGNPPHFMINGKQFGETGPIVDQCMPLNGLQDWVLENWTSTPHPFHIHINPFQVLKIETPSVPNKNLSPGPNNPLTISVYKPTSNYAWQDVITLPPAVIDPNNPSNITPGRVTIRQTYLDFVGTFVLHCHILAHEDRGMMQLVRVVPAAGYPTACQGAIPHHP